MTVEQDWHESMRLGAGFGWCAGVWAVRAIGNGSRSAGTLVCQVDGQS